MSKKPKASFADVMASKKNGRRRIKERVCFSPDLADEYAAILEELSDAITVEQKASSSDRPTTRRAGEEPKSTRLAKEAAALIEANPEAFYELELEQMRRHDWLRLRTQHPPRDDKRADGGMFNHDTFGPAAVRESLVDPEPTDETMEFFEENLSNGEWERLTMRIWALNEGTRSLPKAPQVSSILNGSADG